MLCTPAFGALDQALENMPLRAHGIHVSAFAHPDVVGLLVPTHWDGHLDGKKPGMWV